AWRTSNGVEGVEPPADIQQLWDLAQHFIQVEFGTEASNAIGAEIVKIHTDNLLKIGTVGDIVSPFLFRNDLQNVQPITAKTYDFYWVYPYRPQQWFLAQQ
ncbi:MAG: ABC transporter substrate-binding protein, partial [Okeania sp. SIO3C4]|nr:ABC transporter substrate-binding protein [Okeania sp. SIO3C4]